MFRRWFAEEVCGHIHAYDGLELDLRHGCPRSQIDVEDVAIQRDFMEDVEPPTIGARRCNGTMVHDDLSAVDGLTCVKQSYP